MSAVNCTMRPILLAAVAIALLMAACRKTPPPPAPARAVTPAVAPAPPAVESSASTALGVGSAKPNIPPPVTVDALTEALRTYMQVSSDYPKDLRTLVDRKLIPRLPTLPPGKKFTIDRKNIAVVVVDN